METMSDAELFEGTLADESMKAASDEKVTPKGRYRATVKALTGGKDEKEFFDKNETEPNPYFGKMRWNVQLTLSSIRGGDGMDPKTTKSSPWVSLDNPRTYFLRLCTAVVKGGGGKLTAESKVYADLAQIVAKELNRIPTDKEIYDWLHDGAIEIFIDTYEGGTNEKTGRSWNAGNRVNSVTRAVD